MLRKQLKKKFPYVFLVYFQFFNQLFFKYWKIFQAEIHKILKYLEKNRKKKPYSENMCYPPSTVHLSLRLHDKKPVIMKEIPVEQMIKEVDLLFALYIFPYVVFIPHFFFSNKIFIAILFQNFSPLSDFFFLYFSKT